MKQPRIIGVFLALITVVACGLSCAAAKKPDTLYFEVKMKSQQGDMGTRKMYIKGSCFAWEYDSAGLKAKAIKNESGTFLIWPEKKRGWKYPKDSTRGVPTSYLPGPMGDVKQFLTKNGAKKQGNEKIDGKDCDIYTYQEEVTKWKCKLWVEKKKLIPIKLIMIGEKPGYTTTVTYVKYQKGVDVNDSHFKIAKEISITESQLHKHADKAKTDSTKTKDK